MADSGITKEYLENALGFPIEKFEVKLGSNLGDGYTCAMFGVDVWKRSCTQNRPLGLVIKCYPVNENRQEFLESTSIFQVEVGMYDTVIPALEKFQEFLPENDRISLPFAPFIYGQYVKPENRPKLGRQLQPLDNSIIMPDLRKPENGPFLIRNRFLGLDLDHYKLVIEGQAKLHALSWAYKSRRGQKTLHEDFPILESNLSELFKAILKSNIEINEQMFQDNPKILEGIAHLKSVHTSIVDLYFDPDVKGQDKAGHTKDSILRKPMQAVENEEPWAVLLHGDCWSNNLMFRYDAKTGKPVEVIFIDLQICRESDPMNDLCYGLYFNAQPDLRRKHLQSILRIYFDTFADICKKFDVAPLPGWSWEEFNRRFHRAKILGGYMILAANMVLKVEDELENLDDAAARMHINGKVNDCKTGTMDDFIAGIANAKKLHPSVKPRVLAVFEELIDEGVV